jgi:hypothetical protein
MQLSADGEQIRYLGSTFVPDEESCFCRFETSSAALVVEVCRIAAFPYARILEAESIAEARPPSRTSLPTTRASSRPCSFLEQRSPADP